MLSGLKGYIPVVRHAALTAQNRRHLYRRMSAAIGILSSNQKCEPSSIEDAHCKLSQQTEAAIARAKIAVMETANLRSKYARKASVVSGARLGLGSWK